MPVLGRELGPQWLKPHFLADESGTAEAMPFPNPLCETSLRVAGRQLGATEIVSDSADLLRGFGA
jgi:hypothetical protein